MSTTSTPLTEVTEQYLQALFNSEDEFLRNLNVEAAEAGIPSINIAPEQTRFLQVMLKALGAKVVIEIGSLAGYSAIAMARALPEEGKLHACEVHPMHAAFITKKVAEAGLEKCITVHEGPALETLPKLIAEIIEQSTSPQPIDAVFIDADKPNYANYLNLLLPHVRKGGLIIADNALAFGYITTEPPDNELDNVLAIRAFNTIMSSHPKLLSTLVPLGDGMVIGVVT